jgi:hypothetical protein
MELTAVPPPLQSLSSSGNLSPLSLSDSSLLHNHSDTSHRMAEHEKQPGPGFAFHPFKVASPKPFNGDKASYRSFRRSLDQCFRAEPEKYPEEPPEARILFALSYMQEGLAEQWANHFYDAATATEAIPAWPDFVKQLDTSFTDANTVNIAWKKLKNLVQGRTPAMEYFLNFEYLLLVAGYD